MDTTYKKHMIIIKTDKGVESKGVSIDDPIYKTDHSQGQQTCGSQEGGGGSGMDRQFGVFGCKLLYLEYMDNEALLYSTGNCV